jgi:lipoprotein-releasing system permease protein
MASGRSGSKLYILWIAWRNLVARNRRAGLSFMTIVSIFGVAIGVAALIIVLSVMGGFEQDLRDKMLRGQPHLEIMNKNAAAGFSLKQYPLADFRKLFPQATDVEAFTQADVVLRQKRHIVPATLFGVDPSREGHLWGFGGAVIEGDMAGIGRQIAGSLAGSAKRPGILLGDQLAEQLGAEQGDEITVLSPQAGVDTALGGGTVSRQYVVAGKFHTGLFNYDAKWAVVSLAEGRKFLPDYDESLDADEYAAGVAVNVKDPLNIQAETDAAFRQAGDRFKELDPLTWEKANKSLLFALKLEKFAMGSILMLIVLVAAFSISGTMMMTVFHKRGQVSLLRSLGMNKGDIARLYLTHGFTIGTVGIALGLGFGLGICALIKSFQFIHLPPDVYHLKNLPCKWLWFDYVVICASAWIFSLAASTYPALTAARQDPGLGLRYL